MESNFVLNNSLKRKSINQDELLKLSKKATFSFCEYLMVKIFKTYSNGFV